MAKLLLILSVNIPSLLSVQLSESWKQQVLDIHNELRGRAARGELSNQPAAKNMNQLVWDDGLANIASNYMDTCPGLAHNGNRQTQLFDQQSQGNVRWEGSASLWWEPGHIANGENLAVSSGTYTIDSIVNQIETGWFDEYEDYTFGSGACTPGKMCGHYTQVVWANTRYVGCGYVTGCNGWSSQFVCNYFPAGNFGGTPYEQALVDDHIASDCMSDRTADDSTGLCGGGLCEAMCNGGSYNRDSCDGDCDADSFDDGTGRTIGDSSSNNDDDTTSNEDLDLDTTVACLEVAGFQSGEASVFNGEWIYQGEFNSNPYYYKAGYYWIWHSFAYINDGEAGGYYGVRTSVSTSGDLYGYCGVDSYGWIDDPTQCDAWWSKFGNWKYEPVAASLATCNAAFTNEEGTDGSGNGMTSVLVVVILGLLLIGAGNVAFCVYMKKKMLVKHNMDKVNEEHENEEIEVQMELNETGQ